MRVLVTAAGLGHWSAAQAAEIVAQQWAPWADVAVVPCGAAAAGFVDAWAARHRVEVVPLALEHAVATLAHDGDTTVIAPAGAQQANFQPDLSSRVLGEALLAGLQTRPRRLLLDLGANDAMDLGAGMLSALGVVADRRLDKGVAPLAGISQIDVSPARELLAETQLVGIVADDQRSDEALGLRGITARRGHGLVDPALLLSTDAALTDFAAALPVTLQPGMGAAGGAAAAIAALGGVVRGAVADTFDEVGVASTVGLADLVVVVVDAFDFHTRGGAVVPALVELCAAAGVPCVVLARQIMISARETRMLGVEAAHQVRATDEDSLAESVRRVARSWHW